MSEIIATDSQPAQAETVTSEKAAPSENETTAEKEPVQENVAADGVENNSDMAPNTDKVQAEGKKFAGKYNSVEELEKGYGSQAAYINELKSQIDEYRVQAENQKQAEHLAKLEEARARGFDSVEAQEISRKVILREFELYANNLAQVSPENYEAAREALTNYYSTANEVYLKEAKKYFPDSFIENVAVQKQNFRNNLHNELRQKFEQEFLQNRQELCSKIEENFKDFLSDVLVDKPEHVNKAKTDVMAAMFNMGAIRTIEDMKVFVNLYNSISEQAVKDYLTVKQSQDLVNSVKQKSAVPSGKAGIPGNKPDINSKEYWEEFYSKV